MTIVVLIAVWVVLGLLITVLATAIWKEPRPYGDLVDYAVAIGLAVLTGFGDWYLLPLWFGWEGTLRFLAAVGEPALAALFGLWVLRLIKRRKA